MGSHPINLAIRFILELGAISAAGVWAWKLSNGSLKYLLVIAVPLILMVLWGVFAVPDDPSRSGNAPVPTPGVIRLILELLIFGFGVWCLNQTGYDRLSWIFGILVILHYLSSYDRILWLLKQ